MRRRVLEERGSEGGVAGGVGREGRGEVGAGQVAGVGSERVEGGGGESWACAFRDDRWAAHLDQRLAGQNLPARRHAPREPYQHDRRVSGRLPLDPARDTGDRFEIRYRGKNRPAQPTRQSPRLLLG
jgi:hypothetical protein